MAERPSKKLEKGESMARDERVDFSIVVIVSASPTFLHQK